MMIVGSLFYREGESVSREHILNTGNTLAFIAQLFGFQRARLCHGTLGVIGYLLAPNTRELFCLVRECARYRIHFV